MTVSGDAAIYMGLYDSGVEGEKSKLDTTGEAHLNFMGFKDSFYMFYQIEAREEKDAPGAAIANQEFNEAIIRMGYKTANLEVVLGTVTLPTTVPFTFNQGIATTQVPISSANALLYAGYAESEGLLVTYKVSPQLNIAATLYDKAAVAATGVEFGQTMQVGVYGTAAGVAYKAGYTSETVDNYLDAAPDSLTSTAMNVAVKTAFGSFGVALDYSALSHQVTSDDAIDKTAMSVQASLNKLGPGNLILTYSMETISADDALAAAPGVDIKENAITSVVYDIPTSKSIGVQALYTMNATKWDAAEAADDTTASYVAAGFYGKF